MLLPRCTADLIVVGSAPEAYRLNLAEGRFLAPLPLSSAAANVVRTQPVKRLLRPCNATLRNL